MKKTLAIKIALAGAALGYFAHQCVLEQREQKQAHDRKVDDRFDRLNRVADVAEAVLQERIENGDLKNAPSWKVEMAYSAEFDKQKKLAGM